MRFADRWQTRKDQVFDFAERVLERGVGLTGMHLRVSDTDFVIVQPEAGAALGGWQAACLHYLREILNHFPRRRGQAAPAGVLQVSRISKGRLEAHPIDAERVEAGPGLRCRGGRSLCGPPGGLEGRRSRADGPPEPLDAAIRGQRWPPAAHLGHP